MGEENPSGPTTKTYHVTLRMYYPVLSAGEKSKVTDYFKDQANWDTEEPVDSIKNSTISFTDVGDNTLVIPAADVTLSYHTNINSSEDLADAYNSILGSSFQDLDTAIGKKHTPGSAKVGGRRRRTFKKKRLMSKKYCKKTPCKRMGFTQKASCRPYKNCYQ